MPISLNRGHLLYMYIYASDLESIYYFIFSRSLMTFMVGKRIHDSAFTVNGQFLLMTVQGVDALIPFYIYYKDKHQDDPEDPTPESKAREELLDDPDIFGEPLYLEAKPPDPEKKEDEEDKEDKQKDEK